LQKPSSIHQLPQPPYFIHTRNHCLERPQISWFGFEFNVTMVSPQVVRRWLWTGGITAVTITGTLYGAGLKTKREFKQEKRKLLEAPPEEQIVQLETARSELIAKKNELERKITALSARREAKAQRQKEAER
jgi:hypothetical protein